MFSKILLCSDGSPNSLRAARAAAEMAARFGADLTVLHVAHVPQTIDAGLAAPCAGLSGEELAACIEGEHDTALRSTEEILATAGVPYTARREVGVPGEVITRLADQERFDLVVVGSRGISELRALVLGSVSSHVAHHAHCPVLVVK